MMARTESKDTGGAENIQPEKWDQTAEEKLQLKNKWACDSRPVEHRGQDAGTVIPHEISMSLVGNLASIDIQDTKENLGTASLNQMRLLHVITGDLSLKRFQVAFEENFLEKDQSP